MSRPVDTLGGVLNLVSLEGQVSVGIHGLSCSGLSSCAFLSQLIVVAQWLPYFSASLLTRNHDVSFVLHLYQLEIDIVEFLVTSGKYLARI